MPPKSKGLNCKFALRTNDYERTIIEHIQKAHAELNIPISLNDAIRIALRRAVLPFPGDEPTARRAVKRHIQDCEHCDPTTIGCPDGWMLHDAYMRLTEQKEPADAG